MAQLSGREKEQLLKQFFGALEDKPLAPGDAYYVAEINASAAHDPIAELAAQISWNETANVYAFTGQRGTGKSTELLRLKKRLEDEGMMVFLADVSEYMNLTTAVELSDFLITITGALSEKVNEKLKQNPAKQSFWEQLRKLLTTEVKLEGIEIDADPVSFKFALKDDPDFRQRLQTALQGHANKIVKQARDFAAGVVTLVRQEYNDPNKKVVFIVDSVERIRGVGSGAEAVYKSVENLFSGHAANLRFPQLHVVYTVPPYLPALAGAVGAYLGGAAVFSLPSAHVFKKKSREPDPAGIDLFEQVIAKRFGQWKSVFTKQGLNRLAQNSGGDLRDFFRLIKLCLTRAASPSVSLPVDETVIAHAESLVRNDMLPIAEDDKAWLKRITQTFESAHKSIDKLPTLARYFEGKLVLNYRNGEDWYDVHPLLRDMIDKYVPNTSEQS